MSFYLNSENYLYGSFSSIEALFLKRFCCKLGLCVKLQTVYECACVLFWWFRSLRAHLPKGILSWVLYTAVWIKSSCTASPSPSSPCLSVLASSGSWTSYRSTGTLSLPLTIPMSASSCASCIVFCCWIPGGKNWDFLLCQWSAQKGRLSGHINK